MRKLFSTNYSDNGFSFGILILRLVAGLTMAINHGYGKLTNFNGVLAKFGDPIGIGSKASLSLLIFAEFFCAILLALGLLTRFAAAVLVIAMGVAFFIAHKGEIFSQSGEPSALYLAIFICILFTGPGKVSADRLIGK